MHVIHSQYIIKDANNLSKLYNMGIGTVVNKI